MLNGTELGRTTAGKFNFQPSQFRRTGVVDFKRSTRANCFDVRVTTSSIHDGMCNSLVKNRGHGFNLVRRTDRGRQTAGRHNSVKCQFYVCTQTKDGRKGMNMEAASSQLYRCGSGLNLQSRRRVNFRFTFWF